ncbi:hypothetical protein [Kordia sp.]|uniref:hypothetical protein n=1 Tax=Kordia sp. TaxID=1965332 RepID=UPI003D6A4D44
MIQIINKIESLNFYYIILCSILIFTSCKSDGIKKTTDVIKDTPVVNLAAKDSCCDIKYPALQAEVSGIDLFQKQFQIISFRDPATGNFKYKLQHSPSQNYERVSQGYINYVNALYPCVTETGSTWRLSKGNFGPGHTTRQVTRPNWVGFTSGSLTSTMTVNDPSNFWRDYFEPPITVNASATPTVNGGLHANEIYAIEYGFWIVDTNCNFTQEEKDCMGYHTWVNIRIQGSSGPLARSKGKDKAIVKVDFLDEKGNIIENREMKVIKK